MNSKEICIAGNYSPTITAIEYLKKNYKKCKLSILLNKNDNGKDNFEYSLRKYSLKNKLKIISLNQAYRISNLIFISIHYDKIIKIENFKTKNLYNFHFSLLPKYKGMHTGAHPIINGENYSGVTLHKIDNGIDTGDVIDQIKFSINIHDNAKDLFLKYINFSKILFKKNIKKIIYKKYISKKQPKLNSSYFDKKSINFSKIKINFNKSAYEIHNYIRAFIFEDYQLPKFKGKEIIKSSITNIRCFKKPGYIEKKDKEKIYIATIDYLICLHIKSNKFI